jgi:enoyl-CoA hydratase/carnithine racemase
MAIRVKSGPGRSATIRRLMETEDHKEGVASFLEKREPVFNGR